MYYRYIPNLLSFLRIFLTPLFVVFMFKNTFNYNLICLFIFFIGSISDFFDGYIARKFNFVTDFGKYIDPFADKILIISAFLTLNLFYPSLIKSWMILVIIARDIFVTLFRLAILNNNIMMKTTIFAKSKTLIQIIIIHIILILHLYDSSLLFQLKIGSLNCVYSLMFICTLVAILTGVQYIYLNLNFNNGTE